MEAQTSWRPLGEVIVERGLISQEDLEDALLEQRITHKRLGTILVDKGIVTAQQLTDALVDQIGVEELLDELDHSEEDDDDGGDRAPRAFGIPFRRVRDRLPDFELPRPRRRSKPFARFGHRRNDAPVAPFAPFPAPPEPEDVEESFESAVLELVEYERPPAPEPEAVAEEEPEEDYDGPHAWLHVLRGALEDAEADLRRLDNFAIARSVEADEARSRLAEREAELALESEAHSRAEEEIRRLHALIDERDAGLTRMEGTVEELRGISAATQAELDKARRELDRVSAELEGARPRLEAVETELKAKTAELEIATGEAERRSTRISELEAQVAELAENLSATDETLGIEMHAREQAQRESKRLHEELDDRDARVAKLARQVEALEAELEVVVAEREQSQRKLRSRERRVTKLESMLAELRVEPETASEAPVAEPVETDEPEPEAAQSEPQIVEPEAAAETEAKPKPKAKAKAEPAAEATQAEGFLYFVPRAGEGYELVEQAGSAPAVGDTIELEGKRFEVTRHSRSPLPFDRRACVYLRLS